MQKLFGIVLLLVFFVACSQPNGGSTPLDKVAAEQAILIAVNDALLANADEDEVDLDLSTSGIVDLAEIAPSHLAIRYENIRRERKIIEIIIKNGDPITATGTVEVSITGDAYIVEITPGSRKELGKKPINVMGILTVNAERIDGKWQVVSVEGDLTQGEPATVESWSFTPDPLIAGSEDNIATVDLNEPDTNDLQRVIVRTKRLRPRGLLHDDGQDPDTTANDDIYTGHVRVREGAQVGKHLGFIHALNFTETTDLSVDGKGNYIYPYTASATAIVVEVAQEAP